MTEEELYLFDTLGFLRVEIFSPQILLLGREPTKNRTRL